MAESTEVKDVLSRIAEDNEFFQRMINLLPPISVPEQTEEQTDLVTTAAERKKQRRKEKKREKHMKIAENDRETTTQEKMSEGGKHKISEDATDSMSAKPKKAKLEMEESSDSETDNSTEGTDKLDSVTSLSSKTTMSSKPSKVSKPNIPGKHEKHSKKDKNSQSGSNSSVNVNEHSGVKNEKGSQVNKDSQNPFVATASTSDTDTMLTAGISSIEDKRAKLREKIEQLKAKRNPTDRERLDRRKLKRIESKMKLKQKRKLEKLQSKQNKQNGEGSKPNKGNLNKGLSPAKPVYNKEGQMVFSKFDFTDSGKKEKMQTDLHGKDYKRLLEKIEKRNQKINKLKSKDEGAGKALEDKIKWESVMYKAEGEKVKDNPELLKKAMKRKQKIKDQKKKKWDKRVEHVEKMKDDRQKKRNENIQKRKQAVKDKKIQKLKKKGRILPGF